MENPIAFAARKCLVTEDHYRAWLAHYESPTCQVPVGADETPCGKRVIRVEVPNQVQARGVPIATPTAARTAAMIPLSTMCLRFR